MKNIYNYLRIAENIADVEYILVTNLDNITNVNQNSIISYEFYETVYDKLYRSSAGNKLYFIQQTQSFIL
jgi:hypothetical protein